MAKLPTASLCRRPDSTSKSLCNAALEVLSDISDPPSDQWTHYVDDIPYEFINHSSDCICHKSARDTTAKSIETFPSGVLKTQSGRESNPGASIRMNTGSWQQEATTFGNDATDYSYAVDRTTDPTRKLQDVEDATFAQFFSRPVKIHEYNWGTGSVLAEDFNPWADYFGNARVINRIANFNLMRANLNVKIVINGNGFHYGRVLAGYLPLDSFDEASSLAALVPEDNMQLSQLPHVFLNPTQSSGGTMELPFFWHRNYFKVPDAEWRDMGRVYLRAINALKHANGASDSVTVTVFAWATDVELVMPTARNPVVLQPQSGREDEVDEANKTGMISGPATTISKVAANLAIIPEIAPFAIATSALAKGVAEAAKQMGYCRPPVTKNPDPYRPNPVSSLATTTVPDTAQKLTIDDKQELTIDPGIAGIGRNDPLNIKGIAKRESLLNTFSWEVGTSADTTLQSYGVTPMHWAESGTPPNDAVHLPACCLASLPFNYWTGTINFRFQIVCSSFHKGRLQIAWDPAIGLATTSPAFNTNYIKVVDIATENDFTVSIGMGQDRTLIPTQTVPGGDNLNSYRNSIIVQGQEKFNGVLSVRILNELTVPNSTTNNDIEINCYISAGDDFEVFVPNDVPSYYVMKPTQVEEPARLKPQSGLEEEMANEMMADELDKPIQEQADQFAGQTSDTNLINKVFTGEAISSFRPLLKRYTLHRREWLGADNEKFDISLIRSPFPLYRGQVADAVDTSIYGAYNYVNTNLIHLLTMAHSGWRGGVRWKYLFRNELITRNQIQGTPPGVHAAGYVTRQAYKPSAPTWATNYIEKVDAGSASASASEIVSDAGKRLTGLGIPTGLEGMAYFDGAVNPNVEFEVPFYNENRFVPGKRLNYSSADPSEVNLETYQLAATVQGDGQSAIDVTVATAEDFQVYFFTGMPRLYLEGIPPISA